MLLPQSAQFSYFFTPYGWTIKRICPTSCFITVKLRNKTAERREREDVCVTNVTGLLLLCFVVIFTEVNISGILQKDLFIGRVKFGEKIFQTRLLSHLSHKVCRLLSSPVLLHKFTNYIVCTYAC